MGFEENDSGYFTATETGVTLDESIFQVGDVYEVVEAKVVQGGVMAKLVKKSV